MVFGWRITGRWTGGGKSAEETFVVLTHTESPEEVIGRAFAHLSNLCVRATGANAAQSAVEVELCGQLEQLEEIVPL